MDNATVSAAVSNSCFPALGFNPPKGRAPSVPSYRWWCSRDSDYAFLGFSYSVDSCPSRSQMAKDFKAMRSQYKARYVRIYSACNKNSAFYDQVVAAAYEAGIGVYALVWFGFNGPNDKRWEKQLNGLVNTLNHNRLASYVIRSIAIGSEPLFDNAIAPSKLTALIKSVSAKVKWLGVEVTTSDMAYQFAQHNDVLSAADHVQMNVLPFFAQSATYGNSTQAKAQVLRELRQMQAQTRSRKKIIMTQTGWPSNTAVWKANSRTAEASLHSEQKYYDMLDGQCWTFKTFPRGGVGWFAQIWEDNTLPGWGIVKNGKPKIVFKPKTHC
ncbi:glycoside hydrolase [Auricularia subglabra TFB-10046 SS5]|nr:glycoside hydrolase [Auricularia subglabra TFB-10046 SS5]